MLITNPSLLCRSVVLAFLTIAAPALAQEMAPVSTQQEIVSVPITAITYKPYKRGITATVQLPSASLQALRRRLIAGQSLRLPDLRALADAGDSLAQMRFAKLLSEMNDPTLDRAQVHYFSMAAYNGRQSAVRPLLSLLRTHGATLDASALSNAEAALLAQATHGQIDAISGLAKFYIAEAPFGPKKSEGIALMARVAKSGDYQAALDLALQLMADRSDTDAMAEARTFLEIAAASTQPAVRATAVALLTSSEI